MYLQSYRLERLKNNEMIKEIEAKTAKKGDEAPKKPNPIGYADQAQIDEWKAKHKAKFIHEIISEDDDGFEHSTYVKKPTLELLQLLATKAKQNQELKGLEMVFTAIRLGGSDELIQDDMLKLNVMTAVGKMFKRKEVEVKKR